MSDVDAAIVRAHEELVHALELEPAGEDRFRAASERGRFDRIFGGQLLAQAVVAGSATVTGQAPGSLHAYFTHAGRSDEPVDIAVTRIRDGRSVSTRQIEIRQDDRPLVVAIASFHATTGEAELPVPPPPAPDPDDVPQVQHWVRDGSWVDRPPAVELRIGEPTYFLGGPSATGPRSHWMRAVQPLDRDRTLDAAVLAYASDYFLLDMAFRAHPDRLPMDRLFGLSLDHSIWFHRPVRFDRWHLHTQELLALSGERGLVRGSIHDIDGHLVASASQEVLVRVAS